MKTLFTQARLLLLAVLIYPVALAHVWFRRTWCLYATGTQDELNKILAATAGEVERFLITQKAATAEQKTVIDEMQTKQGELQARLQSAEQTLDARLRPGRGPSNNYLGDAGQKDSVPFHVRLSDGTLVPMFTKGARLADHYRGNGLNGVPGETPFQMGEWIRDSMMGRKTASSSALVPTYLSAQIIDDVRAATVVIQAGAGTIIIDGPTNVAKITGDPTIYEHTEAADDIVESDIVVVPVSLNPKALVALIPLTMEVVADSPNLDAVLRMSLSGAFAGKVGALALAVILADATIPKSLVGADPNAWLPSLAAIGLAMGAKQGIPTAMITNTADFIARASQQAATAGSWLGKPPALASMVELPTTALAAGIAIYGGFPEGFAVAMRQELHLEIVRYGKPTKASHLLVATMRAAGVVLQPKRLYIQNKTVI